MEIRVQSIHFNATEKLHEYIEKKVSKLGKANDIANVDVILKVVKPETAMNKEVNLNIHVAGTELHTSKIADSFEEAIDLCCDSIARQLQKLKEKQTQSHDNEKLRAILHSSEEPEDSSEEPEEI